MFTDMENRHRKFDMAEVTGALGHVLATSATVELSVNRTETRIVQPIFLWSLLLIILHAVSQYAMKRMKIQVLP